MRINLLAILRPSLIKKRKRLILAAWNNTQTETGRATILSHINTLTDKLDRFSKIFSSNFFFVETKKNKHQRKGKNTVCVCVCVNVSRVCKMLRYELHFQPYNFIILFEIRIHSLAGAVPKMFNHNHQKKLFAFRESAERMMFNEN